MQQPMLQRANRAKEVNETIADIIVARARASRRKTGKTKSSYNEFDIEEIAQAITPDWNLASAYGVYEALNTVHGVKVVYDNSLQIGPAEWLNVIYLTLD